jgi:hypothetical protein
VPLTNLASGSSPYLSLSNLIEHWAAGDSRREILMISNGIDGISANFGPNQNNIYVDSAIEKAQRAGIIVSTIATSLDTVDDHRPDEPIPPGRAFPGLSLANRGKNYLNQIAEGTGGESYYYKSSAPVSFAPYLEDYNRRLNSQYLVTFLAQSSKDPSLQSVKFGTDVPHTKLVSAEKVYVPAAQ